MFGCESTCSLTEHVPILKFHSNSGTVRSLIDVFEDSKVVKHSVRSSTVSIPLPFFQDFNFWSYHSGAKEKKKFGRFFKLDTVIYFPSFFLFSSSCIPKPNQGMCFQWSLLTLKVEALFKQYLFSLILLFISRAFFSCIPGQANSLGLFLSVSVVNFIPPCLVGS